MTSDDRRVIQCNYREGTSIATDGARAYVALPNPGGGHDRIVVLVRSRGSRWVRKWENMKRLTNFRIKILPSEHPLYDSRDIFPLGDVDEPGWMEDLVQRLNEASGREAAR